MGVWSHIKIGYSAKLANLLKSQFAPGLKSSPVKDVSLNTAIPLFWNFHHF